MATYGFGISACAGFPELDYEALVGLWLNRARTDQRRAWWTLRAVRECVDLANIPRDWFDALCEDQDEAAYQHELMVNRARSANAGPTGDPMEGP